MTRWRSPDHEARQARITGLRQEIATGGSVRFPARPWILYITIPMLSPVIWVGWLQEPMMARLGAAMAVVAILTLPGVSYPLFVDSHGLRMGGPFHFDVRWEHIAALGSYPTPWWATGVHVALTEDGLTHYERTHGVWMKLMCALSRRVGRAVLLVPALKDPERALSTVLREEPHLRRGTGPTDA